MRSFIFLALMCAPLTVVSAQAQDRYYPPPPPAPALDGGGPALVDSWVRQYLGRAPSREDVRIGEAIDAGTQDPLMVLTNLMASDEYYSKRAGSDDRRYIRVLFRDVAGRAPSAREEGHWLERLSRGPEGFDGRTEVAGDLLRQYPPAALTAPPAPDYRDRYPPDRDRQPYDRDR